MSEKMASEEVPIMVGTEVVKHDAASASPSDSSDESYKPEENVTMRRKRTSSMEDSELATKRKRAASTGQRDSGRKGRTVAHKPRKMARKTASRGTPRKAAAKSTTRKTIRGRKTTPRKKTASRRSGSRKTAMKGKASRKPRKTAARKHHSSAKRDEFVCKFCQHLITE